MQLPTEDVQSIAHILATGYLRFWIAVNTLLRAKGLSSASAAAQEALFDVPAAISAAETCDMLANRIIGAGQEQQFRFTGVIAEERPLRDWLQEILGSCLGYFTFVAGKLRIGLRIHSSVVEAFTTGNILYNSLSLGSLEPRFNDLTAAFADVDYGYQQNALNLYDADHAVRIPGSAAKEFRLDITLSGIPSGGAYGGTLFDLQDVATGSWSFSFQEHVAGQPHAPVEAGDWWKIAPGESRSYKVKGWAYSAADPNSRIATNEITVQVSLPIDEVIPPVSEGTFSLAIDGYTNGEDGEPFANLRVNFTVPSGADVVTAYICEKPHGHTPTPNLTEFTSLTSSTGTTFQSWRRRPKDGARVFVSLTAANQAAGVWRPVDASAPIKWVDIAPWGSPGPVTSPSVSIQNQRTLDGAAYVDIAVNFTPPASPDYWYTKVGRIWRLNANSDPVPGETYEKNGDFGERTSFVIEKVKLQNEPQYQTWRFRPVDWRGNVVEADTVTVNFTLPASTGLDLTQVNPSKVLGFEIVNGKFQPKLGPDFIVDAQGNLTQHAVDLAKAYNLGPEFTKDGGVLAMQGMAVNKLLAGTALFSGDVVFARDSGGSLAINGDGIVAARGGNQIGIGATSVTISGGGQALTISSQGIVGNVGTFNSLVTLQEFHAWNGGTPLFSVNHNGINCGSVLKANAGISVSGTVTGLVRSVNGLQGDVTVSGGEQGPPGPQGPQGPTGPTGPQGPAGPVSSAWDCPYTGWGNSTVATALDNILQRLNQAGI